MPILCSVCTNSEADDCVVFSACHLEWLTHAVFSWRWWAFSHECHRLLEHLQFKWDAHQPPSWKPERVKRGLQSLPQEVLCILMCLLFFLYSKHPVVLDGGVVGTRASGSIHGCWCHKLESNQQQEGIREFFLPSKCRLQSLERKTWDLMGRNHSSHHTGRPIGGKVVFMQIIWHISDVMWFYKVDELTKEDRLRSLRRIFFSLDLIFSWDEGDPEVITEHNIRWILYI